MAAAFVMFAYAALVLLVGIAAYFMAPDPSKATTALVFPAVMSVIMAAMGGMSLLIKKNKLVGMIGIHLGLVLPLLFTVAVGHRAYLAAGKRANYVEANRAFEELPETAPARTDDRARAEFFRERNASDHDTTYQVAALFTVTGLSAVAFVTLIVMRPRPEKRGAASS